jgi:hypothetical protein
MLGLNAKTKGVGLMHLNRSVVKWILVPMVLIVGLAFTAVGSMAYNTPPERDGDKVEIAKQTSDLMLATLFAALQQEFKETTPKNVPQGNHSISLIFNDHNKDMRLVGTKKPLRQNDRPSDDFEWKANTLARSGKNFDRVEYVGDMRYYRRSVALSNFSPACVLCHTNYGKTISDANTPADKVEWVGALMLRVPIK